MNEPKTVLGIDFTSAPKRKKPITCARASFDGKSLSLDELIHWHNFEELEDALRAPGSWVAAIDFPFGQSRRFVENIGWPLNWAEYVELVASLDRNSFRNKLEDYKRERVPGDKQHKRVCDVLAQSQSPQTLYGTPVSLMFFEGAPRLLQSGVHLPYNCDGDKTRVVLEAYPGVAVRQLIGNRGYKNDNRKEQTVEHQRARNDIWSCLTGPEGESRYGFTIDAPQMLAEDPGADDLDALICAVQAAWGWTHRENGFGAPPAQDRLEGWISDPVLADT
jgi:hypothetical protein